MTNLKPIHANEFDVSDLTFSKVRKNKMGGKAIYISNKGNKLYMQLPALRAPFGLSSLVDPNSGNTSYSLDLSLDVTDSDENEKFVKILRQIDTKIIDEIHKHSSILFGKKHKRETMEEVMYRPLVKEPKDPQYAPMMKLKVYKDPSGDFTANAFNTDREKVVLDQLEKGCTVTTIVEFTQIWFIDTKFGVTVKLNQMRTSPSNKLEEYAFLDEPKTEEEETKTEETKTEEPEEETVEEEEETEEEEEEDFVDEDAM